MVRDSEDQKTSSLTILSIVAKVLSRIIKQIHLKNKQCQRQIKKKPEQK